MTRLKRCKLLDLLVNRGLALVQVLLSSERDLWDGGDEIELLFDLFEGLEYDAGEWPVVRTLRSRANGNGVAFLGSRKAEARGQGSGILERRKRFRVR